MNLWVYTYPHRFRLESFEPILSVKFPVEINFNNNNSSRLKSTGFQSLEISDQNVCRNYSGISSDLANLINELYRITFFSAGMFPYFIMHTILSPIKCDWTTWTVLIDQLLCAHFRSIRCYYWPDKIE